MSEQTDALLLLDSVEQDSKPADNAPNPEAVSRARERLRWLQDLKQHPGFKMYLEGVSFEAECAFLAMDKCDNPTKLARLTGEHYAATMAVRYVDNEMLQLERSLKALK